MRTGQVLATTANNPSALGRSAEEVWPEIWPDIKPLIDQVLSGGEASWSEDQLLPIYRNGRVEDVYRTFSYIDQMVNMILNTPSPTR